MTHNAIQTEVDDISSKLKFIGKIEVDHKINVAQGLSMSDKRTWTGKAWRIWAGLLHGEGRDASYNFIKSVIDRAYNLLLNLRHSTSDYDLSVYKKLVSEMVNTEPGLRNLIVTYHSDVDYVTNLETLIDNIGVKVSELCDYKGLVADELRRPKTPEPVAVATEPTEKTPVEFEDSSDDEEEFTRITDSVEKSTPVLPPAHEEISIPQSTAKKLDLPLPRSEELEFPDGFTAVNRSHLPAFEKVVPSVPREEQKNKTEIFTDQNRFAALRQSYLYDLECGLKPPSRNLRRNKRQI